MTQQAHIELTVALEYGSVLKVNVEIAHGRDVLDNHFQYFAQDGFITIHDLSGGTYIIYAQYIMMISGLYVYREVEGNA